MLQSKVGYIDARPLTAKSAKFSCNARPDHTSGSIAAEKPREQHVRYCPNIGSVRRIPTWHSPPWVMDRWRVATAGYTSIDSLKDEKSGRACRAEGRPSGRLKSFRLRQLGDGHMTEVTVRHAPAQNSIGQFACPASANSVGRTNWNRAPLFPSEAAVS